MEVQVFDKNGTLIAWLRKDSSIIAKGYNIVVGEELSAVMIGNELKPVFTQVIGGKENEH